MLCPVGITGKCDRRCKNPPVALDRFLSRDRVVGSMELSNVAGKLRVETFKTFEVFCLRAEHRNTHNI